MPNTVTAAPRQLSDGNSQGTVMGGVTNAAGLPEKISFFGVTPIVQPSGAGFIVEAAAAGGGVINTYNVTLSPSAVAANTTAEQTFTVTGVAGTTSVIVVNKPTTQAGLGIAGVRASAANQIGITFSNDTSGSITPTASQVYQVIEIQSGVGLSNSSALSPAAVLANSTSEQFFTVPAGQIAVGNMLVVNKPTAQAGLGVVGARISGPNQIAIQFINNTAASITPTAAETYLYSDMIGLDAATNTLTYSVNVGTLSSVAANTTAEQIVPVAGILTTDSIVGVSKPTAQAGLGIVGFRVSSAGNVGITFVNATASPITPTANEIYTVTVLRAAPVAPLVVYAPALTPVSVAANTTAEQTFTVTGLLASSAAYAAKPSLTIGLAVVGYRVSAVNTLAVNFQNNTAAAIVPPAETYTVGNFQQQGPGGSASTYSPFVSQAVTEGSELNTELVNAIRNALVALGLVAGS